MTSFLVGAAGLMILTAGGALAQTTGKPAAATAQPGAATAQPGATTATYQDWMLRCVAPADAPRVCEVVQTLQAQGQGVVASVAVGRVDPKAQPTLVIQVPAGVWLPSGVKVQLDEKSKPLQLEFKKCLQACFAELSLDPATLAQLRAASEPGKFTFENGNRQQVSLPLSFKGFTAAFDASLKQ